MRTVFRALAVAVALATVASAQYPTLHTRIVPPMMAGQTAWVHFYWQNETTQTIGQFEMTVTLPTGFEVVYPASRNFSSLNVNNELAVDEVDYTGVRITAPLDARKSVSARANVKFISDGKAYSRSYSLMIPIVRYSGADMKVVTSEVDWFAPGAAQWVHVYFQGLSPRLDRFRVVVSDSAGAVITYPAGRQYTGLYNDSTLSAQEVDYCGFRVDTAGLAVGEYKLQLTITYENGSGTPITQLSSVTMKIDEGQQPTPTKTLTCDVQRISPTSTKAVFLIKAGDAWSKATYRMIGSLSGTSPGLTLNGQVLPLNLDPYLMFTAFKPNEGPLTRAAGKLDKNGQGSAKFKVSSELAELLVGITVYHAFVLLDKNATVLFTSNWVPLSFVNA